MNNLLEQNLDKVFTEIGVGEMPEADKEEATVELVNHFSNVIMETILTNLNEQQVSEFKAALELESAARDEKIAEITSLVPDLSDKIEEAVQRELEVIKAARAELN